MEFLNGKIRPLYFKYLAAALAVVAPIWNIIYSLGLLMGIGGSVIFSTLKGRTDRKKQNENEYFMVALLGAVFLSIAAWFAIIIFDKELLTFFGAKAHLLTLAETYLVPVKFVLPCFLFTQMLAAFLRNDGNPALATAGVLAGGIFNVFGDYILVFAFDMGIFGAGLATAIGSVISCIIMVSHFFSKKNTIKFVKPTRVFRKLKEICVTGFSTFFIDVAMGILTILFNRQIMKYLGTNALSVYGIIVNISTFVQCCAYSVGQASQPIISVNYGAKAGQRIKETLKYAIYSVIFFSVLWTLLSLLAPNMFIKIFMTPTKDILKIAPAIIRCYGISFLLLPLNIFSTYYFQALLKPQVSFVVSVARGLVISGILIFVLPLIKSQYLWFSMPFTELIVAVFAVSAMVHYTKELPVKRDK